MPRMIDFLEKDCAEWRHEAQRWRENHKTVVATKRGVDARLKVALDGLQQIYTLCAARPDNYDHEALLNSIYEISGNAFEKATTNVRGLGRMAPASSE